MTGFELYIFFLCLFVFVALTALFCFLIIKLLKQQLLIIDNGLEDVALKKEIIKKYNKSVNKGAKVMDIIQMVISTALCAFLLFVLIVIGVSSCIGENKVEGIPALKVIASTSMSTKYENNTYLFDNNLDDQLQMFDVIIVEELPPEEELELYDIIVYEHISGALLVHRIIGIEEPNAEHPNERHFLLQGDAVHYPDTFPVRYSQMKSIYRGKRIPNVGSFVYFMQSPAGILCLILIVVAFVFMPIVDIRVEKTKYKRAKILVKKGELNKDCLVIYSKYDDTNLENKKGADYEQS